MKMRRLLTLIFTAVATLASLAVSLKNGIYTDKGESRCWIVNGDTIRLYSYMTGRYMLTECLMTQVDKHFIQLQTIDVASDYITDEFLGAPQTKMTYELGDTAVDNDSIYIKIRPAKDGVLPYAGLVFSSSRNGINDVDMSLQKGLVIAGKKNIDNTLHPKIRPKEFYSLFWEPDYQGVAQILLPEIRHGSHNYITINLPYLDEYFWQRLYFNGVYVRTFRNGLEYYYREFYLTDKLPLWFIENTGMPFPIEY